MYISLISYLKQRDNQTGIRNYSVNSFSRSLLRFVSSRVSDVDRTLLFSSFVHVICGFGLPVALQCKFTLLPSTAPSSD